MILVLWTFITIICITVYARSCSLNPDGRATDVDVLILGAGITGITAARTLEVNGITNFIVLEGSDRIGGRIREHKDTNIEVGANWIHGLDVQDPKHHPIWREWLECDEDGPDGSITPFNFTHVYNIMGHPHNIVNMNGTYQRRKAVFDRAYKEASKLEKILTDDISLRDGLRWKGWTPQTRLDNLIEWKTCDFDSAITPDNASLLMYFPAYTYYAFLGPEKNATAIDYLVADKKGYSFVTECLARKFKQDRVKLNSLVTLIQTADDCVCATLNGTSSERYCGKYGIVTFSIGALHAAINKENNSVSFQPPLPDWKQDAIRNPTPVQYGKVHLLFNTSFWNVTKDQQILGYVANERGYYAYYILDKNTPNMVTVDVAEDLAVKVSKQSKKVTISEIMVILRRIFGQYIPDPYNAIMSTWSTDPLVRCAYTAYRTGVPETVFDDLLKPVNNTLYFAGESMNSSDYGYTHSGYGSGAYVAHLIASEMSQNYYKVQDVVVIGVTTSIIVVIILIVITLILIYARLRNAKSRTVDEDNIPLIKSYILNQIYMLEQHTIYTIIFTLIHVYKPIMHFYNMIIIYYYSTIHVTV